MPSVDVFKLLQLPEQLSTFSQGPTFWVEVRVYHTLILLVVSRWKKPSRFNCSSLKEHRAKPYFSEARRARVAADWPRSWWRWPCLFGRWMGLAIEAWIEALLFRLQVELEALPGVRW